jgi:hypothetical protein
MLDPKSKSALVLFANSSNALDLAKPLIDQALHTNAEPFAWLK